MKVKPVRRKHESISWAYAYLASLRQELGDDAFIAEVRKTAIDLTANGLIQGKGIDESVEILKRAHEARQNIDES